MNKDNTTEKQPAYWKKYMNKMQGSFKTTNKIY